MSAWRWIELAAGAILVILLLADIFSTLLVPGPTAGRPSVLINTRRMSQMLWRRLGSRDRLGRPSHRFAPMLIVIAYIAWMLLLMLGFGMVIQAIGAQFTPPVRGFAQSLYIAGSSMVTLGVSEVDAAGVARWVLLAAGLAGFSVVTATITFSIQVQSALRQRETDILTLSAIAGSPPTGIGILETYGDLDARDDLGAFFGAWRDWSAGVLHSHTSYPVLAYFASTDPAIDWLTALEATLDAATLIVAFTDHPARGQAMMMHRTGALVATRLRRMAGLTIDAAETERDVAPLTARLRDAGFGVTDDAAGRRRFADLRGDYARDIDSIADHLGARHAALFPG